MRRINSHALLQGFLFNAPHKKLQRLQRIATNNLKLGQQFSDDVFLDNFTYQVHCEYLLSKDYLDIRTKKLNLVNSMGTIQHGHGFTAVRNQGKSPAAVKTPLQNSMVFSIKKLNEDKSSFSAYIEAEELVVAMNAEEAAKHKKYLIYLYKLILNQKSTSKHEFQSLCDELKKAIQDKILEGHQHEQERKKVEMELKKIEKLALARECIAKGDDSSAKQSYEEIFQDESNDANVRMEALEFLCKTSQEKGDEGYLLGMIKKLKQQNGEERHRKYVQNTLRELMRNRNSAHKEVIRGE